MMLSAIAPRKDSVESSQERLKQQARDHAPHTSSPLAYSSNADIVTNEDRAKSPDLMRVLSPMRPRRTPKLVNAPEVRWRLAPHLQHIPSLDSLLSSATSTSEASTNLHEHITPYNIALPVSTASSIVTALPDTSPEIPHLSPSPSLPSHTAAAFTLSPAQLHLNTRFNEARVAESPRANPVIAHHEPYLLSPVTEASFAPSIRSSILDLRVQDVGIAECRPLSDVQRQDVLVIGGGDWAGEPRVGLGAWEYGAGEWEGGEALHRCVGRGAAGAEFVVGYEGTGVARVLGKMERGVRGAVRRVAESVARRFVARVLAKAL